MISFKDVAKRYGALEALKGITIEVPQGEIFGYIGPNGAGKTTSLKILTGLITVFDGEATVAGFPLKSARKEVQAIIGYVPQDAGFQPSSNVFPSPNIANVKSCICQEGRSRRSGSPRLFSMIRRCSYSMSRFQGWILPAALM